MTGNVSNEMLSQKYMCNKQYTMAKNMIFIEGGDLIFINLQHDDDDDDVGVEWVTGDTA